MVISSLSRIGRQAKTLTPWRMAFGSQEWLR
jgi:hypothetical protein